jgi:selenocysteine-specific elongation factor
MTNYIIGTCGHIDHGKTALITALNGYEGDSTHEEKQRGITIDLSFSNMIRDDKNVAFIDVPGHEKLVKNMIAGAFSFDVIMVVVSASEKIMPQTVEHLEILNLLGIKKAIVVITKKDLVSQEELEINTQEILNFVENYDFEIVSNQAVSIYDKDSIDELKNNLFNLRADNKIEENFFRYYVDRVFSTKGNGTVVTGTVLGKPISIKEKLFICDIKKEIKLKNIQVHGNDVENANISNRTALNIQSIDAKTIKRGFVLSKKGFLRGFTQIDISYKNLKDKKLLHNTNYSVYLGSKKIEAKILLFNIENNSNEGFATIRANEDIFSIYNEKVIIRQGNDTIAGAKVLSPIIDPMKKAQKLKLLTALHDENITEAYTVLLQAHKKGLGLISSSQRFALSHVEALDFAKKLENTFIDEKALIIYPIETKELIKSNIINIYTKNKYALLSTASLALRLTWASEKFITLVLDELEKENILNKDGNLYKNANIIEDLKDQLENIILDRLEKESYAPTAPYNIYDELDLDRKLGDDILKALTKKKQVIRIQHNLFVHASVLSSLITKMKEIIKNDGFIEVQNFKEKFPMSRKYLIAYLDYLDNIQGIEKRENKRYLIS